MQLHKYYLNGLMIIGSLRKIIRACPLGRAFRCKSSLCFVALRFVPGFPLQSLTQQPIKDPAFLLA